MYLKYSFVYVLVYHLVILLHVYLEGKKKSGDTKIAGCDNGIIMSPSPKTKNKNKINVSNKLKYNLYI